MKQLSLLLAAFIYKHGFCLNGWPVKLLYIAQLETARAICVILE
jgi:hypothetical protein